MVYYGNQKSNRRNYSGRSTVKSSLKYINIYIFIYWEWNYIYI